MYQFPQHAGTKDILCEQICDFYSHFWQLGLTGFMDDIAQQNMGTFQKAWDKLSSGPSLKDKLSGEFSRAFQASLKKEIANTALNSSLHEQVATMLKQKVAHALLDRIPIPGLGTIVGIGADKFHFDDKLGETERKILNDGRRLLGATDNIPYSFDSASEASASASAAFDLYVKLIGDINRMTLNLKDVDDVVAYPVTVFRIQATASALGRNLFVVEQYVAQMKKQLEEINRKSQAFKKQLPDKIALGIDNALNTAYATGTEKGKTASIEARGRATRVGRGQPQPRITLPQRPQFRPPGEKGAANLLAAYVINAFEQGYYDGFTSAHQLASGQEMSDLGGSFALGGPNAQGNFFRN